VITFNGGVNDLSNDVGAGNSDDKSVFWSVILVLVLGDQSLSGIIVGFTVSSSSIFGLETLVVSFGSDILNKCH